MSCDIVIVHGPSDDYTLPYTISQVRKYVKDFRNIYIITHDAGIDLFDEELFKGCKIIDEKIFPISINDVNSIIQTPKRNGWYLQQLLKLYASLVIEEMLDDYVVVDADTLFLKEISFKSGERYMFNMGDEHHIPYFEHMIRVHPSFQKMVKFSGISHHMIFNRMIVSEMMMMVERHHDFTPFWEVFLREVLPEQRPFSGASEYEMYFNYMLKNHKDKVIPRKIKFENTGLPAEYILNNFQDKPDGPYYASLHAWMSNRQPKPKVKKTTLTPFKILSGEELQQLCDVTVITREIENFHRSLPSSVKKVYMFPEEKRSNEVAIDGNIDYTLLKGNKKVFVYTHILDDFIQKVWPNMNGKYVIMTHNSDHGIRPHHLPFLNDNKLIHMFSQNTHIEHPKLTALPIGIANSMWPHGQVSSIQHLVSLKREKKERIYVNVSEGTNRQHRGKVLDIMSRNPLSEFYPQNRPHKDYLAEMSGYKWVLSPKGNGVDCHRLWECMYAGSIAICDDSVNARAFKEMGLPIILVEDYNDVTLETLNSQEVSYEGLKNVLDLNWWKNKINSYLIQNNEGHFILVYIGQLREFVYECVKQIKLWNPTSTIHLCINNNDHNKSYVEGLSGASGPVKDDVNFVYIEDLEMTYQHKIFVQRYTNMSMGGFWRYTMERFFVVEECMRKLNLKNVFHLEIDNMIYFRVEEILEKCKSIDKILIPSDSERRYIAGTCFVNNPDSLSVLNRFFTEHCVNKDEMHSIMDFTRTHSEVDTWPVLPPGDNTRLIYEDRRHCVDDIKRISKYAELFGGVFDAAAAGQFFGGIDPIHQKTNSDGFVNKDSIFGIDRAKFRWEKVNGLQRLNISVDGEEWYPVYNLHIHNKNLKRWLSDIPEMTKHLPNIL
jgi:hypothetical protein